MSVEFSLRQEFYLNRVDTSLFYIKFAVPLTDLGLGYVPDPWQIYLGLSVNFDGENGLGRKTGKTMKRSLTAAGEAH